MRDINHQTKGQSCGEIETTRLYTRVIGSGQPLIILHGGPDFDHSYLLPDLDRLGKTFRLIYYDQRGRGRSGLNVNPEEISLASEMEDLEALREHFRLEKAAILGHSWGALLALEYATRYPQRVSHLVLMNAAPASHADYEDFQEERRRKTPGDLQKMEALAATRGYLAGDLETDTEYNRIHFRAAIRQPALLEKLLENLRANVTPEGIRRARQIEERLYAETWGQIDYSLFPRLTQLAVPTLLVHGDGDFVPQSCAEHIAQVIPGARLEMLKDCGHFACLERPGEVSTLIVDFFGIESTPINPAEGSPE